MTTTNFFTEVTFGQYASASITGYVTMGEQRYVVELVYREGGQKMQEVRAENLTFAVAKEFFRSEYITNGIWKRLVDAMPYIPSTKEQVELIYAAQAEQAATEEPAATDCPMCKKQTLVTTTSPENGIDRAECHSCGYYEQEAVTLVNFFQCDGAISLDREYLENVADGKGEVVARCESLPADLIDELLEANKRTWNGELYHNLLEAGCVQDADEYWERHCKCVSAPSFGFNW